MPNEFPERCLKSPYNCTPQIFIPCENDLIYEEIIRSPETDLIYEEIPKPYELDLIYEELNRPQ